MTEIGDRLKEIRLKTGLKQGEFANQINISQGLLSGIENGNEALSDRNMKLICHEFGVNEDWLRNGGAGPMFRSLELTSGQKELLNIYDDLIPPTQKEVLNYAKEKLELQNHRAEVNKAFKLGSEDKTIGEDAPEQPPGGTTSPSEPPQETEGDK